VVPERACPKIKNLSIGKNNFASATSSGVMAGMASRSPRIGISVDRPEITRRTACRIRRVNRVDGFVLGMELLLLGNLMFLNRVEQLQEKLRRALSGAAV
jgi:hypothetical protein